MSGASIFPYLYQEEGPDKTQAGDDPAGVNPLPLAVGRTLRFRPEFYCLAIRIGQDFPKRLVTQEPDSGVSRVNSASRADFSFFVAFW
jgi:hypothetical protein